MWAAFVLFGLLAVFSVSGSFLGAERATGFFTSVPLAIFWVALLAVTALAFFVFPRLRKTPALFGLHFGFILILVGGIFGSPFGHRVARSVLGIEKVRSGYMVIREGDATNQIVDRDLETVVGELPFQIRLRDFRIEYYEPTSPEWQLVLVTPGGAEGPGQERQELLRWEPGRVVRPEGLGGKVALRVVAYHEGMREVMEPDARGVLELTDRSGEKRMVPAEAGEEIRLNDPPLTIRIRRVFKRLRVIGMGETMRVVDMPEDSGGPKNPALEVEIAGAEGPAVRQYVMPGFEMHSRGVEGLELRYRLPKPIGVEPDPGSERPGVRLELSAGGRTAPAWLIAGEGADFGALPLEPLVGEAGAGAALYLVRPAAPPKDYKSDLVVLRDGSPLREKEIEVNDPLHFGGYHFYQHSYDAQNASYTVLSVVSDTGLPLVYGGLLLTGLSVFWWGWATPVFRRFRRAGAEAGGAAEAGEVSDGR
jgi:hypothetical protein